jgi:putative Mn2+ efflux pump MntP
LSALIFLWLAYKESKGFFYVDVNNPNNYKDTSWLDIYLLGLALSLSDVAGGIAAGIAGFPIFKTTFTCFIVSYILLELGLLIGNKIGKSLNLNNRKLSLVSAFGFFLIGINNLV